MTEKLYYKDAYLKEFDAEVLSVTATDGGFAVILDKTAFFPEEGGQSSDSGFIGTARVTHVYESEGVVYHLTDTAPTLGRTSCRLDFESRYDKMQCHTAEHILCGIIHRLWGYDNVGFHLGADEVTFDIDAVLTREQLDEVELLANRAVFDNIPITTEFPMPEELPMLEYRSKLELTEGVRLVRIGDVDTCACCAPHVARTGEIGLIKVLEFMKHRGGTRIWMVAGYRALGDYREKYGNVKRISAALCEPQATVADGVDRMLESAAALRSELKAARDALALAEARSVEPTDGSLVVLLPDFSIDELRAFSNAAGERVGGLLVALSGADGDYKYVISSASCDLSREIKDINTALSGRGGGRGGMVQGSFSTDIESIRAYFNGK